MCIYSLKNDQIEGESLTQIELNLQDQFDLPTGITSFSINSSNQIATADLSKEVNLHQIQGQINSNVFRNEKKFVFNFQQNLQKISYDKSNLWLICIPDDENACIYNSSTNQTFTSSPGHLGHKVKNGCVDPTGNYFATTGTDGYLNIYEIGNSGLNFQKKIKICDSLIKSNPNFVLDINWLQDGESILISGMNQLGFINKEEDQKTFMDATHEESIFHDFPISQLVPISDEILITHSLEEKLIKIWVFEETGCRNLWKIKSDTFIRKILYSFDLQSLIVMDVQGRLAVVKGDFLKASNFKIQEQFSKQIAQQTDEFDDINMDDFDMIDDQADVPDQVSQKIISSIENNVEQQIESNQIQEEISKPREEIQPESLSQTQKKESQLENHIESKSLIQSQSQNIQNQAIQEEISQKKEILVDEPIQKITKAEKNKWIKFAQREGIDQQETFIPNCKFVEKEDSQNENCVLAWNFVGTIFLRRQANFTSIDVDFQDKSLHRNFSMNDDFNCSMASMNYSGLMIASRGESQDLDKYEEDDDEMIDENNDDKIDKKASYLYFKSFNEQNQLGDWHYKMSPNESIECLAQGSGWCAVYTDFNYIRIFSQEGVQKQILMQGSRIVTMTGYENFLVVIYHVAQPCDYQQLLKFKIIDCGNQLFSQSQTFKIIFDGECPVQDNSILTWAGFSEEGNLITMSNNGLVIGFNHQNNQWIPLLDLKKEFPDTYKQFWIVGFMENEMLAILLPQGIDQPTLKMKQLYKRYKFNIPLLETQSLGEKTENQSQIDEKIIQSQYIIDHEQFRREQWEFLKQFRINGENERAQTASILDNNEMILKKKEQDKIIINAVRLAILQNDVNKVFYYMDLLNFDLSLQICKKFCDQMNAQTILNKMNMYINDKKMRNIEGQSIQKPQKQAFDSRQVSLCLSNNPPENNQQINRKDKIDLNQFAILPNQQAEDHSQNQQVKNYKLFQNNVEKKSPTKEINQSRTTAPRSNPFLKQQNEKTQTHDQIQSRITGSGDIFQDLNKSEKLEAQQSLKRPAPFQKTQQAVFDKQRK